ncbi:methionine biosynthesis protein MetW [Paremcibacter congregatus]|uniref:methionine biosynthesis protein MetW n=1 Tax=Paremcibacter congregatus TaxID=2043170 RepID=UPI0030EE16A1|tara:strand:+ start:105 stop:752 length:648 start_codon:yes stop_codon:yes gene_type:complete
MTPTKTRASDIRVDLLEIARMIPAGSTVLDVGCGDGSLLDYLVQEKNVDGRGIELSAEGVNRSVAKGLSVIQGNAEEDIAYYPDDCFDYVILSQTLQAMQRPDRMLEQLLRVGKKAVVSFPNFGHWKVRANLGLLGTMPVNKTLDYPWYATPNIHFCTIRDFVNLCGQLDIDVEQSMAINAKGSRMPFISLFLVNLLATQGLYVITRKQPENSRA